MSDPALCEILLRPARDHPERDHVRSGDRAYTFAETAELASRLASWLSTRPELEARREVGLAADDPLRTALCVWACVLGGYSVVFLPGFGEAERMRATAAVARLPLLLTDKAAFRDLEGALWIDEALGGATGHAFAEPAEGSKHAFVFQTSGTEGEPKWVRCSYPSVAAVAECMRHAGALDHARDRSVFLTPPLYHSYGLSAFLEYTLVAGTIIFPTGASPLGPAGDLRDPRIALEVSAIEGVPYFHFQFSRLIGRLQLPELRHLGLGGGGLEREVIERILAARPELTVSVRYGLTETPSVVSHKVFHPPHADDWRSSGPILPIFDVAIHDEEGRACAAGEEGEIVVTGSCVAETAGVEEGRLRTRDLGFVSESGELFVVGRRSVFLKHRGFRISPEQLESVARGWPAVRDCRFVHRDGNLRAEVVPVGDFENSTFLAYLARELPMYAVPDEVLPVEEIPRTASGKIKRHD